MAKSEQELENELDRINDELDEERKQIDHYRKVEKKQDKKADKAAKQAKQTKAKIEDLKRENAKLKDQGGSPNQVDRNADKIEELRYQRVQLLNEVEQHEDRSDAANDALKDSQDELERQKQQKQKIKQQMESGEGQLTEHFCVAEFDCNDGTPVPKPSYDALEAWCKKIGEALRIEFGPVHVNSGYRTPSYNAGIGGATYSIHLYDDHPDCHGDTQAVAADITCERGSPTQWYEFTAGKADGRGLYSTFHHADNRNRIGWPDSTWSG